MRSVVAGGWSRSSLSPRCLNLGRVLEKDARVLVLSDGADGNDHKNSTPLRLMGKTRERVRHDFRQGVERRDAHDSEPGPNLNRVFEKAANTQVSNVGGDRCGLPISRPSWRCIFRTHVYALRVRPCRSHTAERRSANCPRKGEHALSLGFNKHAKKLS